MNRRQFLGYSAAFLSALPALAKASEIHCDLCIIGGGVGGFASALAACRHNLRVVLTEETTWIGGQLTAQAVPPDEHPWIEQFGSTRSYREYRTAVREYYRQHYPLSEVARFTRDLNPGNGTVSRLTHEFRVSVAVLGDMLAPFLGNGQLTLLLEHVAEHATTDGDKVTSVTVADLHQGSRKTITAQYFVDATELGDLLPMTKTEFVTGSEAQFQTEEMHASQLAKPDNSQSFTFCFAMDYLPEEDHTIERPADYKFWRDYVPQLIPGWTGPLLNWTAPEPKHLDARKAHLDPNPDPSVRDPGFNIWLYRRLADRRNFIPGTYKSDITLVNWPQNDYWLGDLVTADDQKRKELLRAAKQLSFSFLYWMQTEAPRPDGKSGFKGLRIRKDVVDTEDGMAKYAYIREARRIHAEFTILEKHVGTQMRAKALGVAEELATAENFSDSVGVGSYRIDLHPSAGGTNYIDVSSVPFQIPLGALLPKRMENLLPASKNIGTTHITNGCYRLHPVEWNIGEAVGALVAFSMARNTTPKAVRHSASLLKDFQRTLLQQGFELAWPSIHPV